jgi:hypothetical protein
MAEPTPLRAIDAIEHTDDVVQKLEEALQLAFDGKLSSVAISLVYRDGAMGGICSRIPSYPSQMGSVARLMHRLNVSLDGQA